MVSGSSSSSSSFNVSKPYFLAVKPNIKPSGTGHTVKSQDVFGGISPTANQGKDVFFGARPKFLRVSSNKERIPLFPPEEAARKFKSRIPIRKKGMVSWFRNPEGKFHAARMGSREPLYIPLNDRRIKTSVRDSNFDPTKIYYGSDPAEHKPNSDWEYQVTAYPPGKVNTLLPIPRSPNPEWEEYSKYKGETRFNPYKLGSTTKFPTSYSLIRRGKTVMAGAAGWIGISPKAKIISTSPIDMNFPNAGPQSRREEFIQRYPVKPGKEIIEKTPSGRSNEVVADPNSGDLKTRPTGGCAAVDPNTGIPEHGMSFIEFEARSYAHKLPFAPLPSDKPKRWETDQVQGGPDERLLAVNLKGRRYLLTGWPRPFSFMGSVLGTAKMMPKQLDRVCDFLSKNGFNESHIENIKTKFTESRMADLTTSS